MCLQYLEPKPGNFVSIEDGTVRGTHRGVCFCLNIHARRVIIGLMSRFPQYLCVYCVLFLTCFCLFRLVHSDTGTEGEDRRPEGCLVCGGQRHHHWRRVCGTLISHPSRIISPFVRAHGFLTVQAPNTNHPALYRDTLRTDRFHWVAVDPPPELARTQMMECHFRFIHQMPLSEFNVFHTWLHVDSSNEPEKCPFLIAAPCTVTLNLDGSVWISLAHSVRALTPGQVRAEALPHLYTHVYMYMCYNAHSVNIILLKHCQ